MEEATLEEARAELDRLLADGRGREAEALAAASWRRWLATGEIEAGHALLARVLDGGDGDSPERAHVLYGDGLLLFRLGDQAGSRARNEAARAVARRVGDAEGEGLALVGLSRVAFRAGEYEDVVLLAQAARELIPATATVSALAALHMHAAGARLLAEYDRAAELYLESLHAARRLGDARMVAMEQHNLGHVELHRGDVEAAEELFAARLSFAEASPDPYEAAMTALNDAALAAVRRHDLRARTRFLDCRRLLSEHGIVLDPDDQFELDALQVLLA